MSPIQQLLSDNLKAIRKEKKISQQYIAERSDMLASTYNRIENMKVSPSIETIERVALAIDVPFADLFQSREIKDKSVAQKLEMINGLSDYNKNVINIMLDSVIEKDRLETLQDVKMKKRLAELNAIREKG